MTSFTYYFIFSCVYSYSLSSLPVLNLGYRDVGLDIVRIMILFNMGVPVTFINHWVNQYLGHNQNEFKCFHFQLCVIKLLFVIFIVALSFVSCLSLLFNHLKIFFFISFLILFVITFRITTLHLSSNYCAFLRVYPYPRRFDFSFFPAILIRICS